jgi:hypothetical protein
MTLFTHTQISAAWHKVRSEHGVFFGYTAEQAHEKARAHSRRMAIKAAAAGRMLPLTHSQRQVQSSLGNR